MVTLPPCRLPKRLIVLLKHSVLGCSPSMRQLLVLRCAYDLRSQSTKSVVGMSLFTGMPGQSLDTTVT